MPREVWDLTGERVSVAANLPVDDRIEFWQWQLEEAIEKIIAEKKKLIDQKKEHKDLRITLKGKNRLTSIKLSPGQFKTIDAYRLLMDLKAARKGGNCERSASLTFEFGQVIGDVESYLIFGKTRAGMQHEGHSYCIGQSGKAAGRTDVTAEQLAEAKRLVEEEGKSPTGACKIVAGDTKRFPGSPDWQAVYAQYKQSFA